MLIKRAKPGRAPYWVTADGGLEPDDANTEAAARREVAEELGGRAGRLRQVLLGTDHFQDGPALQHMVLSQRHGPEFADPDRGT